MAFFIFLDGHFQIPLDRTLAKRYLVVLYIPFPYVWFIFLHFDDFEQLLDPFLIV